ncbi:hypothetical protein [Stenotrophomonas sp.]|uniref:hypothetical protein n=1 Tax=Stenotrophomonas sp. TaxID=69392 RepID=UPI0028A58F9B|nr:hypothetical protein [Stenotrophomonas sp.]
MDPERTRRPEIVQALEALKGLLDALPDAGNPEAAIEGLANASRTVNPKWTVPPLGHPEGMNKTFPDGTIRVMLLAHQIFVNPNGAYRIVDLHPPQATFYERASGSGIPFVDPMAESDGAAV